MAITPAAASRLRPLVPPLGMAVPIIIFCAAALAIPLAASRDLGLPPRQTGAWLLSLYGVPGLLSLALTAAYRQPLFVAWHTAVVAFLASLAGQVGYADLLGATLVGGALVALLGALGLTARVAALVPAPVVFAVVAANVLPVVVGVFDALGGEPLVVGGALAYLTARRSPVSPARLRLLSLLVTGAAILGGWLSVTDA